LEEGGVVAEVDGCEEVMGWEGKSVGGSRCDERYENDIQIVIFACLSGFSTI
jgi:hypothetical protein